MERLYHSTIEQHRGRTFYEGIMVGIGDCLQIYDSLNRVTQPAENAPPPSQQMSEFVQADIVPIGRREEREIHRRIDV